MTKFIRIIPRLDIKGPNLVKGIHLEGLRVLGKPEQFAKYYYDMGADELLYMDVVASLYNRNSLQEIISKTASEIFIPLTVGGGLRTIEDIRNVLRAGADKVVLNTAAINNPEIIQEASKHFGSSTITISIEAIRQNNGSYLAFTDNGREYSGIDVFDWAKKAEELGAGEIIITSIDMEGTGEGFDIALTRRIADSVTIPVVACGGAGGIEDIKQVINEGNADAVAIASLFHYEYLKTFVLQEFEDEAEGNTEFIKGRKDFSMIKSCSISNLKENLKISGIKCR